MTDFAIPVIWNPMAGGGRTRRHRRRMDRAASRLGAALEWRSTKAPRHATELAQRAADDGAPLVLAFGGDGTYNEVAAGLLGSPTVLGLLPGGTTSVLRYEFGVPWSPRRALEALLDGEDTPIRVGRTDSGAVFLLMLSAGPDAVVLDRLPDMLKRKGGKSAIAAQAAFEFTRATLPRMRVDVGGETLEGGWVIVGNSRYYAGPFQATPAADPHIPRLELVLQTAVGRGPVLAFLWGLLRGRHIRRGDVVRRVDTAVRIDPVGNDPIPYQLDGDAVGYLPVSIDIHPEPLLVRVPRPGRREDRGRSA